MIGIIDYALNSQKRAREFNEKRTGQVIAKEAKPKKAPKKVDKTLAIIAVSKAIWTTWRDINKLVSLTGYSESAVKVAVTRLVDMGLCIEVNGQYKKTRNKSTNEITVTAIINTLNGRPFINTDITNCNFHINTVQAVIANLVVNRELFKLKKKNNKNVYRTNTHSALDNLYVELINNQPDVFSYEKASAILGVGRRETASKISGMLKRPDRWPFLERLQLGKRELRQDERGYIQYGKDAGVRYVGGRV